MTILSLENFNIKETIFVLDIFNVLTKYHILDKIDFVQYHGTS